MLCIRLFRRALIATLFVLGIATQCLAADKLDPPSDNEQANAKRTISELYKSDYDAAKTPTARSALAKKLIEVGNDTKDDIAAQFVLWRSAKNIAVRAADYDLAAAAINKLDDRFSIDALSMKVEALESVVAAPEAVPNYQKLLPVADSLLTEAIGCERFDMADRACAKAVDFAQKLEDANIAAHTGSRQKELSNIEAAFKEVAPALQVLQTQPLDPDANLAMGRFRCFVKNDWVKGLPMLARSQNEALMQIAKKDLSNPEDPTAQVALADEWWSLAEADKDEVKAAMRMRAAFWYQKAIPKLSGLTKEKAERRAASVTVTQQMPSVPTALPDSNDNKTPSVKPKTPAMVAALVDHEAQRCRSAKDALLIYKLFLADKTVPDEVKVRARTEASLLDDPAAKDCVRLGTKWVSREEAQTAQAQAETLVQQSIDLLTANNAKIAKETLEKASHADPNSVRADFMLGIMYALVGRNYLEARSHFMECVRREPQNVCTLNNLALVEIMLNEHESALGRLRDAIKIDPSTPELAHNIRKVLAESGSKNLTLSASVESSFSELYGELAKSSATEESNSHGWLYMPPFVARIDSLDDQDPKDNQQDKPPKSEPEAPKDSRKHGAKPGQPIVPKRTPGPGNSVILAGGTGFVVYPHYILTNRHVIEGSTSIFLSDPSDPTGKKQRRASIVAQSRNPDLAILRCDELDAPAVGINPHLPGRGTDVMVLGFPEFFDIGTGLKTTRGSIVGLPSDDTEGMCLYDAITNHGNSGGPICDRTGRVVAVVRVIFNLKEMLNGGIPSEQVVPFLGAHIPGFQPTESGGSVLDWPDVDALVSKSTVLILCKAEREPHLTIPDGDDAAFQISSASSSKTSSKRSPGIVKSQPQYIEDDSCIACRGTGMVRCPDCQNGTVGRTEKVLTSSIAGIEVYTDKKIRVPCERCHGTGQIPCPICHGTGREPGT
ncbi:MAG TPA: trypsin-like peptidase domain-containing protein [Pirellulales bacterium]|nr:trypsin-like peptidase domain-containing protein [Pirellulales bacterium]